MGALCIYSAADIINTPLGIFLTNGYNKQWLSEAINEELKGLYQYTYLSYNPYKQELLVFIDEDIVRYWKYSFEYQNWMKINVGRHKLIKPLLNSDGEYSFLISELL